MPQYFFKIRGAEVGHNDEISVALHDDAAALDHACLVVQQLRAAGGYDNPGLVVDVSNELGTRVLSVPFLAACAQVQSSEGWLAAGLTVAALSFKQQESSLYRQ